MSVVENSDNINMENKFHSLYLSGKFLGYLEVISSNNAFTDDYF